MNEKAITITAKINANIQKIWEYYTLPEHVTQWNNAGPDWHTPKAINNLQVGGKFIYTMAAKDGSFSFDFSGVYTTVILHQQINYTMDDARLAEVNFQQEVDGILVTTIFEPETENTLELQQAGWQAILDNFKNYVENN